MTSLVNKSADWTPTYHKILIFFTTKSLKSLRIARIDELADSNEPAKKKIISKRGRLSPPSRHQCNIVLLNIGSIRIYILMTGHVSNETNEDVRMYIEEFILVEIWIHCCTKLN